MQTIHDIAIIGSGFGGSLLALIARRLGRSVVLVERGRHPRFAMGESSTPLANLLLEEMADRYDLPRIRPLAQWGTWQRSYPHLACGLKRGFTFYHHSLNKAWAPSANRDNELLVAASPHDAVSDTHWYRRDFDYFLLQEAQAAGVDYFDHVSLEEADLNSSHATVRGRRDGASFTARARLLIDASGSRGFLQRTLGIPESQLRHLPPTRALYSHFRGVRRWDSVFTWEGSPPYPVDDAAVHHVFEGGWIWVLRFNNGVTSAGVAARADLADELGFAEGEPAWRRLLERLPSVRQTFAESRTDFPFVYAPALPFRVTTLSGPNWAMLPSAAGFIDPLLSTGFPLTLLGILRLAEIIDSAGKQDRLEARLRQYASVTSRELDTTDLLVAALYASFSDFDLFRALSLLYFAAASYTETVRRLGRPELAGPEFLLGGRPEFSTCLHEICRRSLSRPSVEQRKDLLKQIHSTIQPFDVAGLCDQTRRPWYPVRMEDLQQAAPKLGVSSDRVTAYIKEVNATHPDGDARQ